MNIKFAIKNTSGKAEKEGDLIVRYTGVSEPFRRVSDRECKKVGVDGKGEARLVFNTGMDEKKVKFFKWFSEEDKKIFEKTIDNLKPLIVDYYGGSEVVSETNGFFWKENRDVSRLSLSNEDIDVFFDVTKSPVHALLYLSIGSGAFIDLVAPTREWAEKFQIPHYLALETEETFDDEENITRSDAHSALSELRKEENPEALFILAWCIQYDTNAFGAYTKATPFKDLVNYHIKYIDGKIVTKKKKNCPKVFLDYVEKWKSQQSKALLYTEAYVKSGEYYGLINMKEKKYVTVDGTMLGNTISEAVETLNKPKFRSDYEKLREQVEKKWNE